MSTVSDAWAILRKEEPKPTKQKPISADTIGRLFIARVSKCGCAIGNRGLGACSGRLTVHHIAEGSSERFAFGAVCLCQEHHQGSSGFHGLKAKRFCKLYRVPWEKEEGLMVWTNEDLMRFDRGQR